MLEQVLFFLRKGASFRFPFRFLWLRGKLAFYRHTAVNLGAQVVELFLIVGHNSLDTVFVQVVGHLLGGKAAEGELCNREGKETNVIGLKVDLSPFFQHLAVAQQEISVGQAPLGVALGAARDHRN